MGSAVKLYDVSATASSCERDTRNEYMHMFTLLLRTFITMSSIVLAIVSNLISKPLTTTRVHIEHVPHAGVESECKEAYFSRCMQV